MRFLGLEWSIRKASKAHQTVSVAFGQPASSHFGGFLGYGSQIKDQTEYAQIDKIIKAMPFVDVGLRKYVRLCGGFSVSSEDERTADEINKWLKDEVVVDWVQVGFEAWLSRHLRSMFTYGKAIGEVVLDGAGTDIFQLVNLPSRTICLKYENGMLIFGQKDSLGRIIWFEHQEFFQYNVNAPEGNDPHGVSLLRSSPWLSEILLVIENATRQLWQRLGAPPQHIDLKLPDPVPGENIAPDLAELIESQIRAAWKAALMDRFQHNGLQDFTTVHHGDMEISTVGSDMTALGFQEPFRAMTEQVVAGIELPPFMLGIQWATTERLSQQQADGIISCVGAVRDEVEPDCLVICNRKRDLLGLRGELKAVWEEVSLQDRVEQAKADQLEAAAANKRHMTAVDQWRQGFISQEAAAEASLGEAWTGEVAEEHAAPVAPPPTGGGIAALAVRTPAGDNGNGKQKEPHPSYADYP